MARERIGEVTVHGAPRAIEIDPEAGRLELRAGDAVAFIQIRVRPPVLSFIHTEVPTELRGQHVADALARAGLEYARMRQMTVKPFCPFVASYIRRHQEFQ